MKNFSAPAQLTESSYAKAILRLSHKEPRFGEILHHYGPPPFWSREPGFATLIQIILEQQLSLSSARAAFQKLSDKLGEVTPQGLLQLSDAEMKAAGFSRQKTRYARELANAVIQGNLNLAQLAALPDEAVRQTLQTIPGIGPWTAEIYLLMALRRPDVWPVHDLALAVAAKELFRLSHRPDQQALQSLAEHWRPCRAVAARFLWHYYLSR